MEKLIQVYLEVSKEFQVFPKGLKSPIVLSDITGILGKYNLFCPKNEIDIRPLKKIYDIKFSTLKGKDVNKKTIKGQLIAISKTHTLLFTKFRLYPFTNIQIHTNEVEAEIYCKVLQELEDGYLCAFTTDSTPLLNEIESRSED